MLTLRSVRPSCMCGGAGATEISVQGRNFDAQCEVLFKGAAMPTRFVSAAELVAALPSQGVTGTLQTQVRSSDASQPGQFLLSNSMALMVQAPVPPTLAIEPAPIALPPDNLSHEVTLWLSVPDYRDNTISLSTSDASKATVSPASITIPAGQTSAKIQLTAKLAGSVSLIADSSTLQRVSVPVFMTTDFRGREHELLRSPCVW